MSNETWKKENTHKYTIRVLNKTGIPAALENVVASGSSANSYIITALAKQLIADGYLSSEPEQESKEE